jgi:hypothetical protein
MSRLSWALRRLSRTSWQERRLLAEAVALVPIVHQLQQRLPFTRWRRVLERHAPDGLWGDRASPAQVAWAVKVAADYLPGEYKCLPRAYAAHVLLAHHGHRSEVRVGVARDPQGKVEAHAWVECQGNTVIGEVENMERFVRLPDFSKAFS